MLEIQAFKNRREDSNFADKIKYFSLLKNQVENLSTDANKSTMGERSLSGNKLSFNEQLKQVAENNKSNKSLVENENGSRQVGLKKLKESSRDMEAFFIKMLFSEMKKNVFRTSFLKGGFAEEIFDDFLIDEYSKRASKTDTLGIGKQIYQQLKHYI